MYCSQGRRRRGGRGGGGGPDPALLKTGRVDPPPPKFENEVAKIRCFFRVLGYFGVGWPPCRRFDPPPPTQKSVATPLIVVLCMYCSVVRYGLVRTQDFRKKGARSREGGPQSPNYFKCPFTPPKWPFVPWKGPITPPKGPITSPKGITPVEGPCRLVMAPIKLPNSS